MFKYIKNKFFVISFIVGIFIFSYVFGVAWLGLWSSKQNLKIADYYIKKYIIDNTPIYISLSNIKFANSDFLENNILKNSIIVIKDAKYYIKSNIIDILLKSEKKTVVLETYLSMMNLTLSRLNFYKVQISSILSEYDSKYSSCLSKKAEGDNIFFDGLYNLDERKVIEGLKISEKNGSCAEKYRINLSAYKRIYDYLTYVEDLLKIKYELINSNTDMILKNLPLFRDQNLSTLLRLREQIDSFNNFR